MPSNPLEEARAELLSSDDPWGVFAEMDARLDEYCPKDEDMLPMFIGWTKACKLLNILGGHIGHGCVHRGFVTRAEADEWMADTLRQLEARVPMPDPFKRYRRLEN